MRLARHSFLRCYAEAWLYWLLLNVAFVIGEWIQAKVTGEAFDALSVTRLGMFTDPVLIAVQSVVTIPLFAAILVGIRKPTGRVND